MTPEGKIQAYARAEFKALGALSRKVSYEGRAGCPDLIVFYAGRVWLVEVKKDEKTAPEPHQIAEHDRIRRRGVPVWVVGSYRQVDLLVAEMREAGYSVGCKHGGIADA